VECWLGDWLTGVSGVNSGSLLPGPERWAWGEKSGLNPRGSTSSPSSSRGHSIHEFPSSPRTPALAARNQLRDQLAPSRSEVGGVLGLEVCAHVIRDGPAAIAAVASL
jgi:hypothetical protein